MTGSVNARGRGPRIDEIGARGKRELARQRQDWWRFASAVEGVLREVRTRFSGAAAPTLASGSTARPCPRLNGRNSDAYAVGNQGQGNVESAWFESV